MLPVLHRLGDAYIGSCQRGSRAAVAGNGYFGIGRKAGPVGLQGTRVKPAAVSRRHCSVIH